MNLGWLYIILLSLLHISICSKQIYIDPKVENDFDDCGSHDNPCKHILFVLNRKEENINIILSNDSYIENNTISLENSNNFSITGEGQSTNIKTDIYQTEYFFDLNGCNLFTYFF